MNSFKYEVPSLPPMERRRRNPRPAQTFALLAVIGALGVAGYGAVSLTSWAFNRPAVADVKPVKPGTKLSEGEKNLAANEFAGAHARFVEALRQNPEDLKAWDRVRVAAYVEGKQKAPTAADLLPDTTARLSLLLALFERERATNHLEEARAVLAQAESIAPKDARVLGAGAGLMAAQDKPEMAAQAYDQAIAAAPDNAAFVSARYDLKVQLGRSELAANEAIAALRPVVADLKSPLDPSVVTFLAAYLQQGLPADEVRRLAAKEVPALTGGARDLAMAGAFLRHYRLNPSWNRESFDRVVRVSTDIRKPDSGASAALRHDAGRLLLEAHNLRATRFRERSDLEAARGEVEAAIRIARTLPGEKVRHANLHVERARLLTLVGRAETAGKALEAALAIDPTHDARREVAAIQAGLGMGLLSANRNAAALGHFHRAVSLDPSDDGLLARYFQAITGGDRLSAVRACAQAAGESDLGRVMSRLAHGLSLAQKPVGTGVILKLAKAQGIAGGTLAEIQAEVHRVTGQRTLARNALLRALEHGQTAERWLRLGAVEVELAQAEAARHPGQKGRALQVEHQTAAIEAYRHAVALDPDGPAVGRALEATRKLAGMALRAGDMQLALKRAAEGRVLAPTDPSLALTQVEALAKLGRDAEIGPVCAAGLSGVTKPDQPQHAALRLRQGQHMRRSGKVLAAIATLKRGLDSDVAAQPTTTAELWFELAFAHADAGEREEALNASRQYAFWALHDREQKPHAVAVAALEQRLAPNPATQPATR